MGTAATVRIESLRSTLLPAAAADGPLFASPEPGARLGRPMRFSMAVRGSAGTKPVPAGYAVAAVFVAAPHARTTRSLSRGETLAAGDVGDSTTEVGAVLLQRLPRAGDVVGARVLRDVLADEVVSRSMATVRPLVQSGDVVAIRARSEGVLVQAAGVATQSGDEGQAIRVVNRESRRTVKARVVAPGTVEVIQ